MGQLFKRFAQIILILTVISFVWGLFMFLDDMGILDALLARVTQAVDAVVSLLGLGI